MNASLQTLVAAALKQGASDLHLESGLPAAVRVRGSLRTSGEPLTAPALSAMAHDLIGPEQWPRFVERRSFDLSRTVAGVRCRINVMQTARGVGLAVRLLASFQATLERLNLHPDLKRLVAAPNGLVLISGPTGCGKSSTMAALIQEINLAEPRHIVTVESPIEYTFRPRRAFIRQREVGRDTPSFEQALLDALREDPDVLMVGEMREPETMRLTLNAAETGHLVLATVHSGTCAEALQRIASAFPAEIQKQRLRAARRRAGRGGGAAPALPGGPEHPPAGVRNPAPDHGGKGLHPQPRLLQDRARAGDRGRGRAIHLRALPGLDGAALEMARARRGGRSPG